jgi:cell division protein FtsB
MFNWLQHLFTARALQQENAQLTDENKSLKVQVAKNKRVIAVKDEEIQRLNDGLKKLIESQKTPPYDYSKSAATGSNIT